MGLTELVKATAGRFWYLGTTYTAHPLGTQRGYRESVYLGSVLLKRGVRFYSPIVHWHNIALEGNVPNDHDYWMAVDEPMMKLCDGMIYTMMPGHGNSRGMTHEVAAFKYQKKPVLYWRLDDEA